MAQQGETADSVVRVREARASLALAIGARVAHVLGLLVAWRQRMAEQDYLAGLNDRDLRDLGLSCDDVARPPTGIFWRQ